jgi:type II secretory pathway predicted ATPase ExeA
MGQPGTGKSVIKEAIINHDPKRIITPSISRTLHTYSNTLHILCDAFRIDIKGRDTVREKALIKAARDLNSRGKMLVPIIDDAHLLHIDCLRKLRLLFEDFPKNHNLILIAQPDLMHHLHLGVNEDIKSRITFSTTLPKLTSEDLQSFIFTQFDLVGLAHNTLSDDALALILRSSEGILRRARNLTVSALMETVRDRLQTVGLDQVNRVLMQPHWRKDHDMDS